jgi:hypothetical protein
MILLLAWLAHAEIVVEPPPSAGVQTAVTVLDDLSRPVSGATVRAVERSGLSDQRDVAVGLTDARGRVYWSPGAGGPTVLRVRDETRVVHVAYAGPDETALTLLVLLLSLGLGATVVGLWPSRKET